MYNLLKLASTTPPLPGWDRSGKTLYALLQVALRQLRILRRLTDRFWCDRINIRLEC